MGFVDGFAARWVYHFGILATLLPILKSGMKEVVHASFSQIIEEDLGGNFAYVQGLFGSPSEDILESPEFIPNPYQQFQLVFSYWKTSYTSVLDVRV
jgi:hypothetical protein